MSVETYRVCGAVRLSEIVSRERAKDPDGRIDIEDLGGGEYRIEVEPSPDKSAGVEPVRKSNRARVAKTWAPWR